METTIESPSTVSKKVSLSLEAAEVNSYIDKAIKQISKDVQLDGFRKGKVPAKVIEKRFEKDVYDRANEQLVNASVQKSLADNDLRPISRIQFTEIENNEFATLKRDTKYVFALSFDVLPDIDMPKLEEITIDQEEAVAGEKELDEFMHRIRQTGAQLTVVEEARSPEQNDVCLVDIVGTFQGVEIPGMKGENIQMQIKGDSHPQTEQIEKLILSMKPGETKSGKVTLDANYPIADYRDQEVDIEVKLISISVEELPEVNDEFATKFGFADVTQLNEFAKENVLNQIVQKIKAETQTKLLDQVLEKLEYDLPQSLLDAHKSEYLMEARNFLQQQGQDQTQIMEQLKSMEAEADTEATKQAKAQTFLLKLALQESLQVSEKELQEYIVRAARESNQEPQALMNRILESGVINDIQDRLLAAKAIETLYEKVQKNIVDKDGKPVVKAEENA